MLVVSPDSVEPTQIEDRETAVHRLGAPCVFAGCAGFFHAAGGPTGVVLCSPWGHEELGLRKSWRLLAEAIAAAGYPCLRFDYPGTGNSLGRATDPASVDDWIAAINAGADFIRRVNGVRRFVFVGQRLGAGLAAEAARRRGDVVGLHLITPVVKARAYAREMAADAKRLADKQGIACDLAPNEGLNVMGFGLSVPMFESLKSLDLTSIDRLDATHVVVYDRIDRKAAAEAVEHLRKLGPDVAIENVAPGQFPALDAALPLPVEPERLVARICTAHPNILPSPTREPLLKSALLGDTFREEPLRFGADLSLFGVLCSPIRERSGAPAIILLNRGLAPHIGWRRAAVDHARGLAAAGITSLRIDVAGLGESPDAPGPAYNLIFSKRLMGDISAAADELAARGHARIALAGVGSGAYMALTAAHADQRITDIIAINPLRFVWNPNETFDDVMRCGRFSMAELFKVLTAGFGRATQSRQRLKQALAHLVRQRLKTIVAHVPLRLRSYLLHDSMGAQVERFFASFTARGARISLVFSASDPGLVELRTYFGPNGRDFRNTNVSVTILPGADHNLTTSAASAWMRDHMIEMAGEPQLHGASPAPERHAREPHRIVCPT